jgi:hypothetical protein
MRWCLLGACLIGLLVGGIGCKTIRVATDFDPTVSFQDMHRFAWLEPPEVEGASPFADNSLLRKRLRTAVESELTSRGFRLVETPEEADFLATYHVDLSERFRDDGSVGVGVGSYYGGYGVGTAYRTGGVINYQEATLILDIVDPETRALLWRGWGSGVLKTRDRDRSDRRLEDGVQQILRRFPPDEYDS